MDKDESRALRASKDMRHCLGFYPTNVDCPAEWKVYKTLTNRVSGFLKSRGIFGGNARENFTKIAQFAQEESQELWSYARSGDREKDLGNLLPTRDSCDAMVYATIYASMGGYDRYTSEIRNAKKGKEDMGGGSKKRSRND